MLEKKGNSTWVNLDDLRSLFSEEEIEARKKEIMEKMELKRKEDFEAKKLMKKERQELQDKGWNSSAIGQMLRINPNMGEIIGEGLDMLMKAEEPVIIEKEEEPVIIEEKEIADPKEEELEKLKAQLKLMQDTLEDMKKEGE